MDTEQDGPLPGEEGLGLFNKPTPPRKFQRNVGQMSPDTPTERGERMLSRYTGAIEQKLKEAAEDKARKKEELQDHPLYNKRYNKLEKCIPCKSRSTSSNPCDYEPPPCNCCIKRKIPHLCAYPDWVEDERYVARSTLTQDEEKTNAPTQDSALLTPPAETGKQKRGMDDSMSTPLMPQPSLSAREDEFSQIEPPKNASASSQNPLPAAPSGGNRQRNRATGYAPGGLSSYWAGTPIKSQANTVAPSTQLPITPQPQAGKRKRASEDVAHTPTAPKRHRGPKPGAKSED